MICEITYPKGNRNPLRSLTSLSGTREVIKRDRSCPPTTRLQWMRRNAMKWRLVALFNWLEMTLGNPLILCSMGIMRIEEVWFFNSNSWSAGKNWIQLKISRFENWCHLNRQVFVWCNKIWKFGTWQFCVQLKLHEWSCSRISDCLNACRSNSNHKTSVEWSVL